VASTAADIGRSWSSPAFMAGARIKGAETGRVPGMPTVADGERAQPDPGLRVREARSPRVSLADSTRPLRTLIALRPTQRWTRGSSQYRSETPSEHHGLSSPRGRRPHRPSTAPGADEPGPA
jgi:hypothetical protein